MISSEDWFEPFKKGDDRAFRQVFDRYYRPVRYYAAKILQDEMQAEDIVSEAFRKAWDARSKFETPRYLENWLYLVTRNGCLNFLQGKRVKGATELEWSLLAGETGTDTPLDLERVQTRLLEKIFEILETLPGGDVIRMSYLEGKSTKEIAEELHISENNVYIIKSRGLKQLRTLLTKNEWMFFALIFLQF